MTTWLLSLSPQDSDFALAPADADAWLAVLDRKLLVKKSDLTRVKSPFEATVELDGSPDEADTVAAVAEAFKAVGVVTGVFDLALSEHPASDVDYETPPFFEESLDLAVIEEKRTWATVQLDLHTLVPIDDDAKSALDKELRAAFTEPVEFFVKVSSAENWARFALQPMPQARVPAEAELERRACTAAERAGVRLKRVEIGAYVGTWDNTLFQRRIEIAK